MNQIKNIRIEEYNYFLPETRIAKFPISERDKSKLLVYNNKQISDDIFEHVSDYLPENSLLVFNNTKVIQARLILKKSTGAQIEIFCLEPKEPADYAAMFMQCESCVWLTMVGNLKRWTSGVLVSEKITEKGVCRLSAEKIQSFGDTHLIRFYWSEKDLTFAEILEVFGELPIPPYLNRKAEKSDKETYQTVYSKIKGSVAAPTAGLHFTPEVFASLKQKNIICEELTLHVGAGTFKPVKSETIEEHVMHSECISVNKSTIELLLEKEGKIFAVGTTSVRTLESIYYIGVKLAKNPDILPHDLKIEQWFPYEQDDNTLSVTSSLNHIIAYMDRNNLDILTTYTQIMIVPGYRFKMTTGIITNFHQPQSTLLLLISAFVGEDWRNIYNYAMNHDFRFLSYGDSSILL